MTSQQQDELRKKWNTRLYDLRGDLLGSRTKLMRRPQGVQRDRIQASIATLQDCIRELGQIIDESDRISGV